MGDKDSHQSMSDYHPGSWNPAWSVASMYVHARLIRPSLVGLLSFMCTDEMTAGSVKATYRERVQLAACSHAFNKAQRKFVQLFPEYAGDSMRDLPNMTRPAKQTNDTQKRSYTPAQEKGAEPSLDERTESGGKDPSVWSPRNVGVSVLLVLSCLFVAKLLETLNRRAS